jgi:MinD-like ATPase involved in chromosome partitioning or flagellar assembly
MSDQAHRLRELVDLPPQADLEQNRAAIVTVCGGAPGMGSSTLAVHLAIGMSAHDHQAVLVDADLQKASATALAGIDCPTGATIVEMLASWRTAAEILQTGPGGIRILPGDVHAVGPHYLPANAPDRFAAEIDRIAEDSGVVVIDAGFGLTPWNANLWRLADVVLVVTTPEERSILATYTMLKMAAHYGALSKVRIAVNRVGESGLAQEVRRRLGETCFRFLGELVPVLSPLPENEFAIVTSLAAELNSSTNSSYVMAIRELTCEVASELKQLPRQTPETKEMGDVQIRPFVNSTQFY